MRVALSWDDIQTVPPTAVIPVPAEERVQRTERRLIEAALAVNEADTLEDALEALAGSALTLVDAQRISILEWDADLGGGTIVATAGGERARGRRVESNARTRELLGRNVPYVVGPEHVKGLDAAHAGIAHSWGSILVVPLKLEGLPIVSFQAYWDERQTEDTTELATAKLRLLGRLTRVAFRAEAERARAREDARLRAVIEAVPDGLVVRTTDGALVNSAARDLLGVDDPPLEIGLRRLDGSKVPEDDTPLTRAMSTGETQRYVLRVMRNDGLERIHEGTIAPVVDDAGSVFATVTVFRDATEMYEERFVTQQFLDQLFEALPIGVAVTSPGTFKIRRVNRAFLDLIGCEANEVLGQTPPFTWWSEAYDTKLLASDEPVVKYDRLFRRKNGDLVPVEVKRSLIRDADGNDIAVVALMSDQSERRTFEQQLIQNGKLASIGELAAGVAHEINNPLFAILGLVEFLLLEVEKGTKPHERLTLIQETALEIKEIVRALLDFARERSDERAVISLTEVAAQTVELMRRTSAAKQIEIVERYADDEVPVDASPNQIKQIFVNLISNAAQAMKETGGTVTIEVGREGDVAWAEVRDTGPGIPPEALARIFEPFYTTRRDVGGTGLGLSVSFGIAQAHEGSLTAESTSGNGASFRLRLPVAEEAA